jgi:two-component system CheB/CheR fusion protein
MLPKYVVGIGASAGGLEAIQNFFNNMPVTPELTFIIAQHLSPDFVSMMSTVLAHHTAMPILTAKNKMHLQSGAIFLIPAAFEAQVEENQFILKKIQRPSLSLPISILFKSLGESYTTHSIGVILSGTGSDGVSGMQEIVKNHGLTIVQDPTEAKFIDMPNASIATGEVHCVLPVHEIPDVILDYMIQPSEFNKTLKQTKAISKSEYSEIFHLLNLKYKVNFSLYKLSTLSRRIQRRMRLLNIKNLPVYLEYLRHNEEGLKTLYQDLLIGVTEFFRDMEAFSILETQVIPTLFINFKKTLTDIRIWVNPCATGEEAYSIALLFKKYSEEHNLPFAVKIFASDVCDDYIQTAKKGRYSYKSIEHIPKDLIDKYFIKYSGYYEIIPEIRSKVLFTTHNLLTDPPFTKMDLISCRNLLIYIKPKEQDHITNLLRYSLTLGGYLFLGSSEGVTSLEPDLIVNNQHWRVFQKIKPSHYPLIHAPKIIDLPTPEINHTPQGLLPLHTYNAILQDVVTAGFIIDTSYKVLHSVGKARELVMLPEGLPTLVLTKIIIDDLKGALITALHKSKNTLLPVIYDQITIQTRDELQQIMNMSVHPILDLNKKISHYWIRFDPITPPRKQIKRISSGSQKERLKDDAIKALEEELIEARSLLQSSLEIKERGNEELQTTNEELMASNEELQSSNEELQSVNEELYAVNIERLKKVDEVVQAKADIDNLIRGGGICTIILNNKLEIYMFTPSIKKIFKLVDHDIGRPLENFKHNLKFPRLINTIEDVLVSNKAYEHEISDKLNYWYFLKITPYHTSSSHMPSGVVITLTDINETKLLQQKKLEAEADLRLALKTGLIGIWHCDLKTNDFTYDETLMKILALDTLSSITKLKDFINHIHLNDKKRVEKALALTISKFESFEQNFRITNPDGRVRYLSCSANIHHGLFLDSSHITGICWDMTEQYWLEERIIDSQHLNLGLDAITDGWWDWDLLSNKAYLSPLLKKTLGYADPELSNRMESYEQLIYPDDLKKSNEIIKNYISQNSTQSIIQEIRMKHKDGHTVWILSRKKGISNKSGQLIRIICTITNITTLKETERALKKLAYHDSLTQVSNKPVFLEALLRAIGRAQRNQTIFAVMFLDIDNFKEINDKLGHNIGDEVLLEVTNRLTNFSRVIDLLARLGGDEFGILLEEITSKEEVNVIAARYISAFKEPVLVNDKRIVITISIGVALYPEHETTDLELLKHADRNMYLAKKKGKNQFVLS